MARHTFTVFILLMVALTWMAALGDDAGAQSSTPPELYLPVPVGASIFVSPPHADSTSGLGNRNSIDLGFVGASQEVHAAASGTPVVTSSCTVEVTHAGGWITRYHHLIAIAEPLGGPDGFLDAGEHLGTAGDPAIPPLKGSCPGGGFGAHVHFSIDKPNGSPQSVHAMSIGGYTWFQQGENYHGRIVQDSTGKEWTEPKGHNRIVNNQVLPSAQSLEGRMVRRVGARRVWLVQGNQLRYVRDVNTVSCLGGWKDVQQVSAKTLKSIPRSRQHADCEGQMIRAEGDAAVYLIQGDGRRKWVPNETTVECLGGWEDVHEVASEVRDSYSLHTPAASCEGQMIRAEGDTAVYLIQDGAIRHVTANKHVACLGGWEEVHSVTEKVRDRYRRTSSNARCEGQMIRAEGDTAVYLIRSGKRHHVTSGRTVKCLGGWEEVHVVSPSVRDRFNKATPNAKCGGEMIRARGDSAVYLIRRGKRHHILSSDVVACLGGWENVHIVTPAVRDRFPNSGTHPNC